MGSLHLMDNRSQTQVLVSQSIVDSLQWVLSQLYFLMGLKGSRSSLYFLVAHSLRDIYSRSQTQVLISHSILIRYQSIVDPLQWVLSQLHNWIMRELVFPYGSQQFPLEFIFLGGTFIEGYLDSLFICMHQGIWENMQGFTRTYE